MFNPSQNVAISRGWMQGKAMRVVEDDNPLRGSHGQPIPTFAPIIQPKSCDFAGVWVNPRNK